MNLIRDFNTVIEFVRKINKMTKVLHNVEPTSLEEWVHWNQKLAAYLKLWQDVIGCNVRQGKSLLCIKQNEKNKKTGA